MNLYKPRIVFFVPEWPASDSPILDSHVLSLARLMSEDDCNCLFIGCDTEVGKVEQATRKIENQYGIQAKIYLSSWLCDGYLGLYFTTSMAYRKAKQIVRDFKPTHVYARSAPTSKFSRKLATQVGAISVLDVRGILAEEQRLKKRRKGFAYFYLLHLESYEYLAANKIVNVSINMREYFRRRTSRKDSVVIPSCYDEKKFFFDIEARAEIRQQLGLNEDHWLLCYSGGLSRWQRIKDILVLFAELCNREQQFRFLFLTKGEVELKRMLREYPNLAGKCYVKRCTQDEVYKYLSAADAGIIMRHDTIVNNVASPIKIGEYLGCGLPVIFTQGIGDFGKLMDEEGVGLMLDERVNLADQITEYFKSFNRVEKRRSTADFARRHFLINTYLVEYRKIFS